MNGAHDLGGRMGFGPVKSEANEPVFHAPWEARMFAVAVAFGVFGAWNLDEDRAACEGRPPGEYLRMSYYEIWYAAMVRLLVEKRVVEESEMKASKAVAASPLSTMALRSEAVVPFLSAPSTYERPGSAPAIFAVGDRVRARNMHPAGHTRLARYLRGHLGEIIKIHGAHVFPDSNATGQGEDPRWLYTVRFAASELWGRKTMDFIYADMWEPYLEPA